MKQYIIKRLMVMVPTLFFITLVVFVILQAAPGKPGGPLMMDSESASQTQQGGYLIFKQQFHLDKPILINLRFQSSHGFRVPVLGWVGVSQENVRELLSDAMPEIGLTQEELTAKNESADGEERRNAVSRKVYAIEELENLGNAIVPQLVGLIQFSGDEATVKRALYIFPRNARRPLIHRYGEQLSEDEKILNREIDSENRRVSELSYSTSMTDEEVAGLRNRVLAYWRTVMDRWDTSFLDHMRTALFDTRFANYMKNLLTLDFGISHVDKRPVLPKIMDRLGYSVLLSTLSILLAYVLAIPIGIYSAVKPKSLLDQGLTVTLFMLYSLPTFFVGTLLLFYFSEGGEYFKWFPTGGYQSLAADNMTFLESRLDIARHLILPLICMTYVSLASISRYARTGLLDVIHADYVKTARAKGLKESVVILKHAVRNGLIPILTLLGTILPTVVSGSVIIEVIFNIPGIGLESYNAVKLRDYNMVMAIQLISAVLTLIGLLISDILYCIVDPRISYD